MEAHKPTLNVRALVLGMLIALFLMSAVHGLAGLLQDAQAAAPLRVEVVDSHRRFAECFALLQGDDVRGFSCVRA